MVSAYTKTVFRTFKNYLVRFLAMIAIVALGVGFVTGLSATSPNMKDAVNQYFIQQSVPDVIVKAPLGLTSDQYNKLINHSFVEQAQAFFSTDIKVSELITRLYYLPLQNQKVNKIELVEGDWPQTGSEVLIERSSQSIDQVEIGSPIEYQGVNLKVVGIAADPLFFSQYRVQSNIAGSYLDQIIYFDSNLTSMPDMISDVYIKIIANHNYNIFSKEYERWINECIDSLKKANEVTNPLLFLTFQENTSIAIYKSNLDKIEAISFIFPVFFVLIAALVVLTTMTRLAEEERIVIGCYKTLGFGNRKILMKYIFYALMCSIVGSVLGIVGGFRVLPMLIYSVFNTLFYLPPLTYGFYYTYGIITAALMILALVGVTWYAIALALKENPANLLRPKSPKHGKTIFLEKIPFIWKRLKFKYKSTFRNVFRHVKHFVMTVISIAGCMTLVLAGLGLYDSMKGTDVSKFTDADMVAGMIDSIVSISILLILSAGILSLIVIYNLTNINIEERKKEIATLKVLGYKTFEVAGYIFREIFILSCFGILVGLPLGYGLLKFVLAYMTSDAFQMTLSISWYSWLLSIMITVLFIVIVDLLLLHKIAKVDMNSSLKSND